MGSVNKVILLGRIGQEPDIRSTSGGDRVCNLSLATSERWKRDGEQQERTEWHRVTVWNQNLIGIIEKHVSKGSLIYVSGQLQTRKWQDQSGADRYTTEVVLGRFGAELQLVSRPPEQQQSSGGTGTLPLGDDLDDEIPF